MFIQELDWITHTHTDYYDVIILKSIWGMILEKSLLPYKFRL